jgi:hypothetical protein
VVASAVFALVEIPKQSKTTLRACLVLDSFLYWAILSFGNSVTTLLVSTVVVENIPAALSRYYFLFYAFFGVFGFETVLKNTNITIFDQGVLTIQNWIDSAKNAAVASAIAAEEVLKGSLEIALQKHLNGMSELDINTRILTKSGPTTVSQLEDDAKRSSADAKKYKVYYLISKLDAYERMALLKEFRELGASPN